MKKKLTRRIVPVVARLLAEALGLLDEDRRRIRLWEREDDKGEAKARKAREDPVDPAPVDARDLDKARHDGAETGARKRREAKERHGPAARVAVPDISEERARVGQRRRRKRAAEETEDEQRTNVGRQRAPHLPASVEDKGKNEDWPAPVRLGKRAPQERNEAVAGDKERNGQNAHFGADVVVRLDGRHDARRRTRGEGRVEHEQATEHRQVPSVPPAPVLLSVFCTRNRRHNRRHSTT